MKRTLFFTGILISNWLALIGLAQAATIFTVTSNADSGAGSFRQAIADAVDGDTIQFSPTLTSTIILSSSLTLGKNLTITGPGASVLFISGNSTVRVLNITGGTSSISGLTLCDGKVTNGNGAGISMTSGALTLDQCVITGNVLTISVGGSYTGAGIHCVNGTLTINRCQISNNRFVDSGGVGISDGGGLYVSMGGDCAIYNSVFSNNSARYGSAITAEYATLNCINVTICGNDAVVNGAMECEHGTVTLKHCTLTRNKSTTSGAGGLVAISNTTTLQSTIIAGNADASGSNSDLFCSLGAFSSLGNNLIGSTGSRLYLWTLGDVVGTETAKVPANLGYLADYGGWVPSCLPSSNSQAIDPEVNDPLPFADARGYLRVNTADKGSVEGNGVLPVALAATVQSPTSFIANWQAVSGATDYALDVATDNLFVNVVSGWGNSLVGNTTSWLVTGLASQGTYYYRMRARNDVYQSWHSNTIACSLAYTPTSTMTPTNTTTPTETITSTATSTSTATPTLTFTSTDTMTSTVTPSSTLTFTSTVTPTITPSVTSTFTATITPTSSKTLTATAVIYSSTPTQTCTPTTSATQTQGSAGTHTATPTASVTPTQTATHSISTATTTPQGNFAGVDMTAKLFLAYPNPARDRVSFLFSPERSVRINIWIRNMNGEPVTALEKHLPAGRSTVVWECQGVAPGIYLARIAMDGHEVGKAKVAVVMTPPLF